ncbi:hypothetical protein [Tateyamaria omphalii]
MTKTKTRALTDMRPAMWTALLLIAVLLLTACNGRRSERVAFDGQFFRANASKVDRRQREQFEVTVSPVSASLDGAREAGRYEAIRYCIQEYGSSDIEWAEGPDAEDGTLRISNDRLLLRGTCTPA